MAKWLQAALLGLAVAAGAPAMAAGPIRISTSDMPPLAIEATPDAPGGVHEVVTELLRRARLPAQIAFVPWQRALFLTNKRSRSAIFPLTRSPERESQYRWLVRLYQGSFVLMSLKDKGADPRAPALGKQQRIGVLRGSLMIKLLKDQGYQHLVEASSIAENVRMLRRGMVDAIAGERAIYRATLKGFDDGGFRTSPPIATTGMWLAGSTDFGEADAALLQKVFKDMVDDGSYARILKKYEIAADP